MEEDVEMTEENKYGETFTADGGKLKELVKDLTKTFITTSKIQKNNYSKLFTLCKMREIMDKK